MKILSLFDGISCGRLALERAGISVEKYDAFETDRYALKVSANNFPDIIQHGDVFCGDFTQFQGYDLLIGGSPCTYWSIAKKERETDIDGEGFRLFRQYLRALEESGCRYFLYENNYSIHKNIKNEITKNLGVQPVVIDSSLVSAQQRKRCYWTNIPDIPQPENKNILLNDVLEKRTVAAVPINDTDGKSRTVKAQYSHTSPANAVRQDGFGATMVAEKINAVGQSGKGGQRIYSVHNKSVTLSADRIYRIDLPDGDYIIRRFTPVEAERLQTLPDNYTAGISNTRRYKCIGNAWTVDVIAHIFSHIHDKTEYE